MIWNLMQLENHSIYFFTIQFILIFYLLKLKSNQLSISKLNVCKELYV